MVNIIVGRFINSFMALLRVPMNWIGVLNNIKSAHKFFLAICAVHKVRRSRMRLRIRGGAKKSLQ